MFVAQVGFFGGIALEIVELHEFGVSLTLTPTAPGACPQDQFPIALADGERAADGVGLAVSARGSEQRRGRRRAAPPPPPPPPRSDPH